MTSTIETATSASAVNEPVAPAGIGMAAIAATGMPFVGDPNRIAQLTDLNILSCTTVSDPCGGDTVVLVPRIPADGELTTITDETLEADLGGAMAELLVGIQATLPSFDESISGTDRRGHLIIVLPAEPALGQVGSAVSGAFCGAALSLARTLALELARDRITVNTVLHGAPTPAIRAGLAAQLLALAGSDATTGQEIYVSGGTDLGRLRP